MRKDALLDAGVWLDLQLTPSISARVNAETAANLAIVLTTLLYPVIHGNTLRLESALDRGMIAEDKTPCRLIDHRADPDEGVLEI